MVLPILARINVVGQQPACLVPAVVCIFQRNLRQYAERNSLPLTGDAVLQTPPLATTGGYLNVVVLFRLSHTRKDPSSSGLCVFGGDPY
jgi:hypothetical protein